MIHLDQVKPRILYLIDNLQRGGAEVSLMEITSRITAFEVVVYTLYDQNNGLKQEFLRRGIRVECLGVGPGYLNIFRTRRFVARLMSESPVLIHSTLYKADIFSRCISIWLRVPLVNSFVNNSYDQRRYDSEKWNDRMKVWVLQWIDRLTAPRVYRFISNSSAIRDSNCKALGIDQKSTVVIPRGRVVPEWNDSNEKVRKDLQLQFFGRAGICFMSTGRLIERKGQGDLLTGFAQIRNLHPEAFLVIVGEGPFRKLLEQQCSELKITENVILTGLRSDVPELLRAADFFVFPSWYEGLPGSVVESMLAGVPIIASDIPENRECTGDYALLHRVRDPEDLARIMLKAIDFKNWPVTARAAYDRARQLFDIDEVVRRYELLYSEAIRSWASGITKGSIK